jgi:hypothetical protein
MGRRDAEQQQLLSAVPAVLAPESRARAAGSSTLRVAAALLTAIALVTPIAPAGMPAWAEDVGLSGFAVSLQTHRPAYRAGETVSLRLDVAGGADRPVRFEFSNAQRFDFSIENMDGTEVWRWSSGQMFAAALGQEILDADHARLSYRADIDASLPPGLYRAHGVLTDARRSAAAMLVFRVE